MIRLKPTVNALEDLKAGRSDLMLGMDAYFHHEYAMYGKSVVQLFTHSVVHRKDEPATVQNVEDLAQQRVIVHDGSVDYESACTCPYVYRSCLPDSNWFEEKDPYAHGQDYLRLFDPYNPRGRGREE